MAKVLLKIALTLALLIAFFWASNEDYKETVIHSMPNHIYYIIKEKVGDSRGCIVAEYMDNKVYYDSLR